MDPDTTLAELRETARLIQEDPDAGIDTALDRLDRLEQLFTALDSWLTHGGSKPADWG